MAVICTKPTTPESRKRHAEIFGEKPDRYCKECGRLPAFCECLRRSVDCKIEMVRPLSKNEVPLWIPPLECQGSTR
jgi:hypothetical protein